MTGCAVEVTDPASSPSPSGGKADGFEAEAEIAGTRFADAWDSRRAARLGCGVGNGHVRVGGYDVEAFEPSAALEAIRALDDERGCPGRRYSRSRQDAMDRAAAFGDELVGPNLFDETDGCTYDGIFTDYVFDDASEYAALFLDLATDEDANAAVFSSEHDPEGADDPVACFYYRFLVYRSNGTAISMVFDYAD